MADVGNPAIALSLDLGLIGAPPLKIAVPDQPHIAALGATFATIARRPLPRYNCGAQQNYERHADQIPSRHIELLGQT
jgi:hypothetical protein